MRLSWASMPLQDGDVVAFLREPVGDGDLSHQPFLMEVNDQVVASERRRPAYTNVCRWSGARRLQRRII
jgi:hypothetical protein